MGIRSLLGRMIELTGYTVQKLPRIEGGCRDQVSVYDQDGLRSIHNHEFMEDPSFIKAYRRGVLAAEDYHWHWRVHIGLWVAYSASRLAGDFVECGVNRGFMSSAIMEYLDWDALGKKFYLLDTFAGPDDLFLGEEERKLGALERNEHYLSSGFYVRGVETVRANFSQWKNVRIIQGPVPETLKAIDAREIAFLHLDMNSSFPEVQAFNFLWERMIPGGFVLLDDYAHYDFYKAQKSPMDAVAKEKGLRIASLPTGQGLLLKPS
jgi:hypothetical protein